MEKFNILICSIIEIYDLSSDQRLDRFLSIKD